jgi:hypothetical protein
MKTALIHIGWPKTGTSSLQYFLEKNRKVLWKQGYLLPRSLGFANHINVAVSCHDFFRGDDLCKTLGLETQEQWSNFDRDVWQKIRNEVHANPEHHLLLSSEIFVGSLETRSEIERLKKRIAELGFSQIKVIMFLRNPSDMMQSHHFTDTVYWGRSRQNPPLPDDPFAEFLCDIKTRISLWDDVFGRQSIVARLYEPEPGITISAIDDFLSIVPELDRKKFRTTKPKNTSSSALGIEVAARVNFKMPFIVDGKVNPLRKELGPYLRKKYPGESYVMPNTLRKSYDSYYAASNEWVRAEFFPHRDALFHPKNDLGNSSAHHYSSDFLESEAEEAIRYLKKRHEFRLRKMAFKKKRNAMLEKIKNIFDKIKMKNHQ